MIHKKQRGSLQETQTLLNKVGKNCDLKEKEKGSKFRSRMCKCTQLLNLKLWINQTETERRKPHKNPLNRIVAESLLRYSQMAKLKMTKKHQIPLWIMEETEDVQRVSEQSPKIGHLMDATHPLPFESIKCLLKFYKKRPNFNNQRMVLAESAKEEEEASSSKL